MRSHFNVSVFLKTLLRFSRVIAAWLVDADPGRRARMMTTATGTSAMAVMTATIANLSQRRGLFGRLAR